MCIVQLPYLCTADQLLSSPAPALHAAGKHCCRGNRWATAAQQVMGRTLLRSCCAVSLAAST